MRNPPGVVLTIDGLTEGTHFRSSWGKYLESRCGFSLGRALGWKLLGSSLSDLAAMGPTTGRWALIYLGAPALQAGFLENFYAGLKETAGRYDCALAGGDTVKARELTLVAAVGGRLTGSRAVSRSGARPGDLLCVAGAVGDAAVGLGILRKKIVLPDRRDGAAFVRRFFEHAPRFSDSNFLTRERGVTSMIDLSDSLQESIGLLGEASRLGATVNLNRIPVSRLYQRWFRPKASLLSGGEDYALHFTLKKAALSRLLGKVRFSVIGEMTKASSGIRYFLNGAPCHPPPAFRHFQR